MTDGNIAETGVPIKINDPGCGPDAGGRGMDDPRGDGLTRLYRNARTVLGKTAIGTGGGGLLSYALTFIDKTGISGTITAIGGATLGFLGGLSDLTIRHRREGHAADAEPNHAARVQAERATAEALRHLDECHAEVARLSGRVDTLELNAEIARRENQKLMADVVDLAKRLVAMDGRKA